MILSKSDPFERARAQKESRMSTSPSAPIEAPTELLTPEHQPILQSMGIDHSGLALGEVGRNQLMGRFQAKLGENFMSHPMVAKALEAFDAHSSKDAGKLRESTNKGFANTERTLKALLGGR